MSIWILLFTTHQSCANILRDVKQTKTYDETEEEQKRELVRKLGHILMDIDTLRYCKGKKCPPVKKLVEAVNYEKSMCNIGQHWMTYKKKKSDQKKLSYRERLFSRKKHSRKT